MCFDCTSQTQWKITEITEALDSIINTPFVRVVHETNATYSNFVEPGAEW